MKCSNGDQILMLMQLSIFIYKQYFFPPANTKFGQERLFFIGELSLSSEISPEKFDAQGQGSAYFLYIFAYPFDTINF